MLLHIVFLIFHFTGILQQIQQEEMSSEEISVFKEYIHNESKSITSVRTDFTQKKKMDFLEHDIVSKGQMLLNDQGFLKWQYTEPNVYSIVFKNNQIYINDNGNKSTANVDQRLFKKINTLISGSIKGNVFNDEEFTYNFFKNESEIIVKMLTKDKIMKKYIQNIELTFPKNKALVSDVKLIEPSGNYTLISFNNRKINVDIDKKEFDL